MSGLVHNKTNKQKKKTKAEPKKHMYEKCTTKLTNKKSEEVQKN